MVHQKGKYRLTFHIMITFVHFIGCTYSQWSQATQWVWMVRRWQKVLSDGTWKLPPIRLNGFRMEIGVGARHSHMASFRSGTWMGWCQQVQDPKIQRCWRRRAQSVWYRCVVNTSHHDIYRSLVDLYRLTHATLAYMIRELKFSRSLLVNKS